MKDVVIYRSECEASRKLLTQLTELPIAKELLFYSVDPDPVTRKRNIDLIKILEVNFTPTVYIKGRKYEGKAVFEWLNDMVRQCRGARRVGSAGPVGQGYVQEPVNGSMRLPVPQVTNCRAGDGNIGVQQHDQGPPCMDVPETMDFYRPMAADGGGMFAQGSMDMFSLQDAANPDAFTLCVPESTRGNEASMRGDDLQRAAEMMAKERQQDIGRMMQRR